MQLGAGVHLDWDAFSTGTSSEVSHALGDCRRVGGPMRAHVWRSNDGAGPILNRCSRKRHAFVDRDGSGVDARQ
jgi:hypothetical protein